MKYIFSFLFALWLLPQIQAQGTWDLFLPNHKMYWNSGGQLRLCYMDSTIAAPNDHSIHLFGSSYLPEALGPFYEAAATVYCKDAYDRQPSDPWASDATSWYFLSSKGDTIRFYQNAVPGDTWDIPVTLPDVDVLRISCENVTDEPVLNQTRAVKNYRVLTLKGGQLVISNTFSNANIKLAKGLGFIRFIAQTDMNMTTLTRPIHRPLCHEGRHQIVALSKNLSKGFK